MNDEPMIVDQWGDEKQAGIVREDGAFGRWTVVEVNGRHATCRCSCGATKRVRLDHLRSGRSTSCGCSRRTSEEAFWDKVHHEPNTGCWLWVGHTNPKGYGQHSFNGCSVPAYRHSLAIEGRGIPKGMQVDHLCRTPRCVNPDHLEVVTASENTRRAREYAMRNDDNRCKHGHRFDYTRILADGRRRRVCRTCNRRHHLKRQASLRPLSPRELRDLEAAQ